LAEAVFDFGSTRSAVASAFVDIIAKVEALEGDTVTVGATSVIRSTLALRTPATFADQLLVCQPGHGHRHGIRRSPSGHARADPIAVQPADPAGSKQPDQWIRDGGRRTLRRDLDPRRARKARARLRRIPGFLVDSGDHLRYPRRGGRAHRPEEPGVPETASSPLLPADVPGRQHGRLSVPVRGRGVAGCRQSRRPDCRDDGLLRRPDAPPLPTGRPDMSPWARPAATSSAVSH
jgi:hypothetical protein